MHNYIVYSPKDIETEPLKRPIIVHGAMHYKCQACGRIYRMWLERGLEDRYAIHNKAVPFTIGCLCGGLTEHVAWHLDIEQYTMQLEEHMDYFENSEVMEYGIPHLRTDGDVSITAKPDPKELLVTTRSMSGIKSYSTTQLKEELRRRKRS